MLFVLVCLVGLSCRTISSALAPTVTPSSTPTALPTAIHTITATAAPPAAPLAEPAPSQTQRPLTGAAGFSVRYHPDGGLYAGDRISFEILAPAASTVDGSSVMVELETAPSQVLAQGDFFPFGIGQRMQATLIWTWNTQDLAPGEYTLRFTVLPNNISWRETVSLQPREDLPLSEQQAAWASITNACCTVHYLTHTEVERDLPELLTIIDDQARIASDRMSIAFSQPITITLLPRLMGHGGFATDEIHVSYLDRNYADGQFGIIMQHEMVHILDSRLGGDLRPDLLVEGLAVHVTGGHYRPGPLLPQAATLLDAWGNPPQPGLDHYLPLSELADNFYTSQHEISYLQAGALVDYMISTWGWQEFSAFYRDIHPHSSGSQSQALDAALQVHFDLNLVQLEQDFIAALRQQPASADMLQEVQLTITYYDTLRAYQRQLDPSAYFLHAWLLDTPTMRQSGITADYLRQHLTAPNLALETLLITVHEELRSGDYTQADRILEVIRTVLQAIERGDMDPFSAEPLAADYLSLVQAVQQDPFFSLDHELQRLEIENETARAWVSNPTAELFELLFTKTDAGWQIQMPVTAGDGE